MSYITSKHGDLGIMESAVVENATNGIRINTICATFVWIRMMEDELKHDDTALKVVEALVPIKRMAEAEMANTAVFLDSPRSTYTNGVSLMMDAASVLDAAAGVDEGAKPSTTLWQAWALPCG